MVPDTLAHTFMPIIKRRRKSLLQNKTRDSGEYSTPVFYIQQQQQTNKPPAVTNFVVLHNMKKLPYIYPQNM